MGIEEMEDFVVFTKILCELRGEEVESLDDIHKAQGIARNEGWRKLRLRRKVVFIYQRKNLFHEVLISKHHLLQTFWEQFDQLGSRLGYVHGRVFIAISGLENIATDKEFGKDRRQKLFNMLG